MAEMAPWVSVLSLRCAPEQRDAAIAQFIEHRVLETCRDAVPGFLSGRMLKSCDDAGAVIVICEWVDQAAFEQWMNSPRRNNQSGADRLFAPAGRSALYVLAQGLAR